MSRKNYFQFYLWKHLKCFCIKIVKYNLYLIQIRPFEIQHSFKFTAGTMNVENQTINGRQNIFSIIFCFGRFQSQFHLFGFWAADCFVKKNSLEGWWYVRGWRLKYHPIVAAVLVQPWATRFKGYVTQGYGRISCTVS